MRNKGNYRLIRERLVWMQYEALQAARKGLKSIRISHLWAIRLLGESEDGLRIFEAQKITGGNRATVHGRFNCLIKLGLAVKGEDKRYRLSDSGQLIYTRLNEKLAAGMDDIIQSLMEEARRRL